MAEYDAPADRPYLQALWAHAEPATIWSAETTVDERDPYPGEPSGTSELRLIAGGSYEGAAEALTVTIERGGYGNGSARFLAQSASDAAPFGWDPPVHVVTTQAIQMSLALINPVGCFGMVEAGDGSLICVRAWEATAAGEDVRIFRRASLTSSWALVGTLPIPSPGSGYYPANRGACPVCWADETGATYIAIQRHIESTSGLIQPFTSVDVYRAAADADWSSNPFALMQTDALSLSSPSLAIADKLGGFMAATYGNGQVLLLMGRGTLTYQLASADLGASWTTINASSNVGTSSATPYAVAFTTGFFLAAHYRDLGGTPKLCVRRVGSAFADFDNVPPVDVRSSATLDTGTVPALVVDDTGKVYLYAQDDGRLLCWVSEDAGTTWSATYATVWETDDKAVKMVSGAWWKDRAVLGMLAENTVLTSDYSDGLMSCDLGGYTTMALAPDSGALDGRRTWDGMWWPGETPASAPSVTRAVTGTPTENFAPSPPRLLVTVGAGEAWSLSGSLPGVYTAARYRGRAIFETDTFVELYVVGATYGVTVLRSSTQLLVLDAVGGGTLIGPTIGTGAVDVIVALDDTAGTAEVWYRFAGPGRRAYVRLIAATGLTSGTPTPKVSVELSAAASAFDVELRGFWFGKDAASYEHDPTLPYGRPLSAIMQYAANGVLVGGLDGPALPGETFTVPAVSDYGTAQAAASATYSSPRLRFESQTAATNEAIAWTIPGGASTAENPRRVWGAWIETNAPEVRLDFHDGSSWITGPTIHQSAAVCSIDLAARVAWARSTTTGATPGAILQADELAGGYLATGTTAKARILGNTAGAVNGPAAGTANKATIRIDPDGVVAATATRIIPARSVALLDSTTVPATIRGFRLVLIGAPLEGRWQLKACVGPLVVLGEAHGKDTRRRYVGRYQDTESRDGVRSRERLAPREEVIELSWQSITDPWLSDQVASVYAPHLADAAGVAIAARGETLHTLRALCEAWGDTGTPCVYSPWFARSSVGTVGVQRAYGAVLGTLEGDWMIEHVGAGEEMVDEVRRGGTLTLRQLT